MELPKKNFLIYDGDCGFCQNSINILEKIIGQKIEYLKSYKFGDDFYGVNQESFQKSIKYFEHIDKRDPGHKFEKVINYDFHDVHENCVIYHGAYAIFKALSLNRFFSWLLLLYKYFPGFSMLSEAVYAVIARHRHEISKLTGATECKIN